MNQTIIIFVIITFINVILSTMKSILTVKASREVATLINAISYGFYAMVVKQMSTVSTEVVVIATILCNLVGVYFSMWLLDKFKKDKVWKVSIIATEEDAVEVKQQLIKANLSFTEYEIKGKHGFSCGIDIYSKDQKDSKILKEILSKYNNIRYHYIEIGKEL